MKLLIPILALVLLAACRPVRTTQDYYNEYVNPVASIDYEDSVSANVPADFLDDYYTIDSKIVRFADQLDLLDARVDSSWIDFQKSVHPWIKYIAILDQDQLFVSGDDALGFDPEVRTGLLDLSSGKSRYFLFKNDRAFFIHYTFVSDEQYKATVVEVDLTALTAEIPNNRTIIAIDDQICGPVIPNLSDACIRVQKSTKYSGSIKIDASKWYWIRSMGSDNLVYLHLNQE
jgi:hypothetical protein